METSTRKALEHAAAALERVLAMREAQRVYFKVRNREALIASKQLEGEVDHAAADALQQCRDELAQEGMQ